MAIQLDSLSNVLFFSVALVGLFLLWKAKYPRRVGTLVHCLTCGYCLHGLTSSRCPECGTPLSANSIAMGERARSRRYIPVAAALIAPALFVAASMTLHALSTVNWYSSAPNWYLLHTLRGSNVDSAKLAAEQINHRWPTLSGSEQNEVLDICLEYQAKHGPVPRTLMTILGGAFDAHTLTTPQRRRFLEQDLEVTHDELDPLANPESRAKHRWGYDYRCPTKTLTAVHYVTDIKIDGHPIGQGPPFLDPSRGSMGPCSIEWGAAPFASIGHHTLTITIDIRLYDGSPHPTMVFPLNFAQHPPYLEVPPIPPAFSKTLVFTHTFEVVPSPLPPPSAQKPATRPRTMWGRPII